MKLATLRNKLIKYANFDYIFAFKINQKYFQKYIKKDNYNNDFNDEDNYNKEKLIIKLEKLFGKNNKIDRIHIINNDLIIIGTTNDYNHLKLIVNNYFPNTEIFIYNQILYIRSKENLNNIINQIKNKFNQNISKIWIFEPITNIELAKIDLLFDDEIEKDVFNDFIESITGKRPSADGKTTSTLDLT